MSATITRRLVITIQQSHDEAIRAQLFATFAAYGTVEVFVCESSANYDKSIVTVQFQRLSAAEQLQTDAVRSGREWRVLFQRAVPSASAELLVSSRRPLDAAELTSLARDQGRAENGDDAAPATASSSRKPRGSTSFFEEKLLRAPGRATKDDDAWASFASRNVAAVQSCCIGPYVGLLRFKDAHTANAFLAANQLSLANLHDMYITFISPPPPPSPQQQQQQQYHHHQGGRGSSTRAAPLPLHTAVHSLLTCQPVSELQEGDTLRGFIVEARSTAVCVVDAGVVDDAGGAAHRHHHRHALLVETHTNFLKTRLRDEVLVQLRTVDASSRTVQATLLQTVNEGLAVSGSGRLLLSGARGGRGLQQQQQQQPGVLPLQPFMSHPRGRNTTPGSTPPSSQDSSLVQSQPSLSQPQLPPSRKLTSRLFQSIQQRKAEDPLFTGGGDGLGASGERICAFPVGLHPFSLLLVRVERVETGGAHPGLHATSLGLADGKAETGAVAAPTASTAGGGGSGSWPVFIPASLLPSAEGEGWQSFAVAGERMTVALLYAVAVGDSRATLRCVASKLDADTRRAATLAAGSAAATRGSTGSSSHELSQHQSTASLLGNDDGYGCEQTDSQQQRMACETGRRSGGSSRLAVGDVFSAMPVRLLDVGDLCTGGARDHFPCWVVLPQEGRASELLCVLPQRQAPEALVAAAASMVASGTGSALRALPLVEVVLSDIVHSSARGHYAVVTDAAVYQAAEEKKWEQLRRQKEENYEQVKRRLAAVLGEDAVRDVDTGESKRKTPRVDF